MLIFFLKCVSCLFNSIYPINCNFYSYLIFLHKFIYSFLKLISPLNSKSFISYYYINYFFIFLYKNFLFLFYLAYSLLKRLFIFKYILYLIYNLCSFPFNVFNLIFKLYLLGYNAMLKFFKG
jgi:hypothetical protein